MEQPNEFVICTKYKPEILTSIVAVVAPVFQRYVHNGVVASKITGSLEQLMISSPNEAIGNGKKKWLFHRKQCNHWHW